MCQVCYNFIIKMSNHTVSDMLYLLHKDITSHFVRYVISYNFIIKISYYTVSGMLYL